MSGVFSGTCPPKNCLFCRNFDLSSIPPPSSFTADFSWHCCGHLHSLSKFLHALLNAPLNSKQYSYMSRILSLLFAPCAPSLHLISMDPQSHKLTSQRNNRSSRKRSSVDWNILSYLRGPRSHPTPG